VRDGSYGKLFEAVITAILNGSRITKLSINDKYAYLGAFASKLYDDRRATLGEGEMRAWHRQYWDAIAVDMDYEPLKNDLLRLGMLEQNADGSIGFKYKYCYCFFVAHYLSRYIHEPNTQQKVKELCGRLYHPETGDIILFLAHLSENPLVLNEMRNTAASLFPEKPLADLEHDVEPLNSLGNSTPELILPDSTPEQNRRELLERKDDRTDERKSSVAHGATITTPPEPTTDEFVETGRLIHASFKTIQILGQALRNSAGLMPVHQKREILHELFQLSRRLLGHYYSGADPLNTRPATTRQTFPHCANSCSKERRRLSISSVWKKSCLNLPSIWLAHSAKESPI
jgi:hypothetical protein